jgi:hypothetical protein
MGAAMTIEKTVVPAVPTVPANIHAGFGRNQCFNEVVPLVPKTSKSTGKTTANQVAWTPRQNQDTDGAWEPKEPEAKPSGSHANPHGYWLEPWEPMEPRKNKVLSAHSHKACEPGAADPHSTDLASTFKRLPLTAAERQRRFRAKRKAVFAALQARVPADYGMQLVRENADLLRRLEIAGRQAQEQGARMAELRQELEPLRERFIGLRAVLRGLLGKLSPAMRHVARRHLQETGFIEWLDAD